VIKKTVHPDQRYDLGDYQTRLSLIVPLVDGLLIVLALFVIGLCYWQVKTDSLLERSHWWLNVFLAGYLHLAVLAVALYFLISFLLKSYRPGLYHRLYSCISSFLPAWGGTIFILLLIGSGAQMTSYYSRLVVFSWFLGVPLCLALWHLFYVYRLSARYENKARKTRTVIIGMDVSSRQLADFVKETPHLSLQLVGYYDDRDPDSERHLAIPAPYLGTTEQCVRDARENRYDLAYLCMPITMQGRITSLLKQLSDTTVSVFYLLPPDLFFNALKTSWHSVAGFSAVSVFESPHVGFNSRLKRTEDLVLASIILVLIALPMLLIALAVKLSSPGPILFRQRRYGMLGKEFKVLKFRTMTVRDDGDVVRQATVNDPRVTPLGRYLRRYSLDELPQFINVLKGEMSIVGPRPHAVAHNEAYRKLIPGYMLRHKVKPGITGLAQVNGCRGETETMEKMEARVQCDLEYIQTWSLGLDLKIILCTCMQCVPSDNVY